MIYGVHGQIPARGGLVWGQMRSVIWSPGGVYTPSTGVCITYSCTRCATFELSSPLVAGQEASLTAWVARAWYGHIRLLSRADCCRKLFPILIWRTIWNVTDFYRLCYVYVCLSVPVVQLLHVRVSAGSHKSFQSLTTPVWFSVINVFLWCCVFKQINLTTKSAVRQFRAMARLQSAYGRYHSTKIALLRVLSDIFWP